MNIGKGIGLRGLYNAMITGQMQVTGDNWSYCDTDYHLYWVKVGDECFTVFDDCGALFSEDDSECKVFEGTQGGLDADEEEIWDDEGEYPEPLDIDPIQGNGHDGPRTYTATQAIVAWCRAWYVFH